MKKTGLLVLLSFLYITGCTYQTNKSYMGTWDMQYSEWSTADTTFIFNKSDSNQQIKVFCDNHYVWLQQDLHENPDNKDFMIGGAGTFSVSGDTLFEILNLSPWQDAHGKSFSSKIEVNGDTLIQWFPYPGHVPEIWNEWTGIEIYIRMD